MRRRPILVHSHHESRLALAIRQRHRRRLVGVLADEQPARTRRRPGAHGFHRRITLRAFGQRVGFVQAADQIAQRLLRSIPHLQAGGSLAVVLAVGDADGLVLLQLIEHDAGVGAAAVALRQGFGGRVVGAGIREAAHLIAFVVEEQHAGHRPRPLDGDAVHHTRVHAVLVRQHEPQRAVGVDDVQALHGQLINPLRRRGLRKGGDRKKRRQAEAHGGVDLQNA